MNLKQGCSPSSYARNRPIWPSCIPAKIKFRFRVCHIPRQCVTYILDVRTSHCMCPLLDRFYLYLSQKIFWAYQHQCFDALWSFGITQWAQDLVFSKFQAHNNVTFVGRDKNLPPKFSYFEPLLFL
jgi:hypothetical protein